MNWIEADKIVREYGGALARTQEGIIFKLEEWLPTSRDRIEQAFKIVFAINHKFKIYTEEEVKNHLNAFAGMVFFITEHEAIELSKFLSLKGKAREIFELYEPEKFNEMNQLFNKVYNTEKANAMIEYLEELDKMDVDDDLHAQKIYTMIGLEYKKEYKETFSDDYFYSLHIPTNNSQYSDITSMETNIETNVIENPKKVSSGNWISNNPLGFIIILFIIVYCLLGR